MAYRIGIFDPAFKKQGHFIPFNAYIASLVDRDSQIVFFDQDGLMEEEYRTLPLPQTPEFVRLPSRSSSIIPGRLGRLLSRYESSKKAFSCIQSADIDLLLITAESRDPLMYWHRLRVPYAVYLLYPYSYIAHESASFIQKMYAKWFRDFVSRACVRFTTSEPPIRDDMARLLGMSDITWVPNMPVISSTVEYDLQYDFLTLGTISKSKNHLFALTAFEKAMLPYRYHIAGSILDDTAEQVQRFVKEKQNSPLKLSGEFGYVDENRYASLLRIASFMVFPYDNTRGRISSQVLHDSFSAKVPFIAPSIEPFAWYAREYGIGIIYENSNPDSFIKAIQEAHEMGPDVFRSRFERLQETHSLEAIRKVFSNAIDQKCGRSQ